MAPEQELKIDWASLVPRYLVPIDPSRMMHYFTDVLVIGGGLAGLRAAHEIDPSLQTIVVTKDKLEESNSSYAQGGIASVWDPEDRFDNHVQDTLTAGGSLCDPAIVTMVVEEAPGRVQELMQWGTRFDAQNGSLVLGREGGHSHQRIIHALGDATGKEIMRAMMKHTREQPNVQIWESTFTIDLITHDGRCRGAIVSRNGAAPMMVWAKETILSTGGCGQVFRESTNPRVATGDGHALAFRAGVKLRDMEFMQFHPTVLYIAGSSRTLITEAVRGEGAYLVDANGYRFMPDYDSRLELAPRDVVSQSIARQMDKTQNPCVYLTLKHLDAAHVRQRFPGIDAVCKSFGLDITKDAIPVRPGAHYMIGGATVDGQGRTSLAGLWAAGEVTSSGLHGANRLASNSLLEGLVFGASAGKAASQAVLRDHSHHTLFPVVSHIHPHLPGSIDIADLRNSVRSLMWRNVGVERKADKLEESVQMTKQLANYVLAHSFDSIEGWELQNLLTVALMMSSAALERCESRGVHLRIDYPKMDDVHWRKHLVVQR
jgi:L-aspartate oxidase